MEKLTEPKNLSEFLNVEFQTICCDKPFTTVEETDDPFTGITITSTVFI